MPKVGKEVANAHLAEKLCLLEECGVDLAIVADFGAVRDMDKNDFITELLVGKFNCRAAVCGFNYRFGSGALGDSEYLTAVLAPHGIPTLCVDEVSYGGTAVSSTIIRHALSEARISDAAALLGKPYYIRGVVGRGLGLGGTWGIPTVNTALPECGILLPSGVYETAVYAGGTLYPALTNVGVCPTVSERAPHAETYIIDYNGDLYGEDVKIYFVEFIREEIRFPDKDSLIERIKADIESVSKGEPRKKWQTIGLS